PARTRPLGNCRRTVGSVADGPGVAAVARLNGALDGLAVGFDGFTFDDARLVLAALVYGRGTPRHLRTGGQAGRAQQALADFTALRTLRGFTHLCHGSAQLERPVVDALEFIDGHFDLEATAGRRAAP